MPMTTIPYARDRAFYDEGYVTRMSDLMLEASRAQQVALRQTGAAAAQRWTGAGQVIAGTLADVAKQRDYRRQLELRAAEREQDRADTLEQRGVENAFREKSHAEQVAERQSAEQFRRDQFRDSRASAAADDVAPFDAIPADEYRQRYQGTVAAPRFRPEAESFETDGVPFADSETYTRVPNGAERLAISNAASQERARVLAEQNRVRDDKRQGDRDIATANHQAEMLRVAEARLSLQRQQAQGNGDLTPRQTRDMFQMSNALKAHPAYTDMLDIYTGWQGVQSGLKQDNGFGDITAINAFQRMVDPGATVREGDVALLQSASSLIDKVLSDYPIARLRDGAKLPDAVRQRMAATARDLYSTRSKNYNDTVGQQYRQQAAAVGVPFNLIGIDFEPATPVTAPAGGAQPKPKVTRDAKGNLVKAPK